MFRRYVYSKEKGQAILVIAILALILFAAVALSLVIFFRPGAKLQAQREIDTKAYYLAESGINWALNEIQDLPPAAYDEKPGNYKETFTLPRVRIPTEEGKDIEATITVEIQDSVMKR